MKDDRIGVPDNMLDEVRALQRDPEYLTIELLQAMNEAICVAMKEQGVSKKELAKRLGWRKNDVTAVLEGDLVTKVGEMVAIAAALGLRWTEPQLIPLRKPESIVSTDEYFREP